MTWVIWVGLTIAVLAPALFGVSIYELVDAMWWLGPLGWLLGALIVAAFLGAVVLALWALEKSSRRS